MALKWLFYDTTKPDNYGVAPFDTYYGLTAPNDVDGQNGDLYIRYHNGNESEYKKVNGVWQQLTLTSAPYQNGKIDFLEEVLEAGVGGQTEFQSTIDFSDEDIDVLENGIHKEEYTGLLATAGDENLVRDGSTNKITFKTTRPEGSRIWVRVFSATAATYIDGVSSLTAFENVTVGEVCRVRTADGKLEKVLADTAANSRGTLYIAKESLAADALGQFYRIGSKVEASGTTPSAIYYLSAATAGALVTTAPSASGNAVIIIGEGEKTDFYNFQPRWVTTLP